MATPNEVGLDAVFKTQKFQDGLAAYIAGQARAVSSTRATASQMTSLGGAVSGGLGAALGVVSPLLSGFANILTTAVGTAIGHITGVLIPQMVSGLYEIGAAAVSNVAELQRLTIVLETLSAKELVQAGAASDMAEGLRQAGPMAEGLLQQLRGLSIVSPFEYQDVVNVFRLNMAFGQSSQSAIGLTKSILDLAAGMGLTGPFLERIAYNFSQMQLVGKITARDIRDLAMAGVDLAAVLRDELGMSMQAANAALQDGSLTFKDVSEAFMRYADRNFAGAAQRASRSLGGLASSFRDLLFFASADVFGPAFDRIGEAIGGVFDKALELVDSGVLRFIGIALDEVAAHAMQAASPIAEWAGSLFENLNATFEDIITAAFDWGANIVLYLARGIIAAAGAIIQALLYIASIIAAWLGPGSPPKIAPQLPEWGRLAMEEFLNGFAGASTAGLQKAGGALEAWGDSAINALLKGFTGADFDIFDSILGPLEQALGIMEQLGDVTEESMRESLASVSEIMAAALDEFRRTGEVGPEIFEAIKDAGGELGDELSDLLQKQLELAAATKEVEEAEKAVAEARKAHENASKQVNALTSEYNKMLREGASKEQLDAKLKEINAAEKNRNITADQVTAEEERLKAAKEALEPLKEAVKLQEELIRQLLELARQQIPPSAEGEEPPGDGEGPPPEFEPPDIPPFEGGGLGDLEDRLEEFRKKIKAILDQLMKDIKTAFEESGIGKKWKELWDTVTKIWNKAWPIIKEKWDFVWGIITKVIEVAGTLIGTDIRNIVEDLEGMAKYLPSFGDVVSFIFGMVLGVIIGVTTPIVGAIHGIATAIDWMRQVLDYFAPFWDSFADAWKDADWIMKGSLIINAALTLVAEVVALVLAAISGFVWGFVEGVITFFKKLAHELVGGSIVPEMMQSIYNIITTVFQNVLTWIGAKLIELATAFSTKATEIKTALSTAWTEIQTTATTIWTDITTALTTKAQEIYTAITTKIAELQTWWGSTWGAIRDTLGGIWEEIVTAAGTKIGEVVSGVIGGIDDLLKQIAGKVSQFYKAGSDLIGGMVQGVLDSIQSLINAVIQAIKDAIEAARRFLEAFSPSKKTMRLSHDMMEGFRLPIETEGAALADTLNRSLRPLMGQMVRMPSMASRAALAPAPVLGGNTTNIYNNNYASRFDFGRNNVGSPADLARMESMITRVVRKELRKR